VVAIRTDPRWFQVSDSEVNVDKEQIPSAHYVPKMVDEILEDVHVKKTKDDQGGQGTYPRWYDDIFEEQLPSDNGSVKDFWDGGKKEIHGWMRIKIQESYRNHGETSVTNY
jgi:hypothetical protein